MQKSIKNPSKIHANFVWENKIKKNTPEMDLGRSWAPFGKGLGRSGASFGRSWALLGPFQGRSKSSFCEALVQNGLQERLLDRFWVDFAKDLGGFREDLGRFWGDLGQFWHGFWTNWEENLEER